MPGPTRAERSARLTHLSNRRRPRPARVIFCVQDVISPLLANIYLHYVLDLWAHRWREKQAFGDVILVR